MVKRVKKQPMRVSSLPQPAWILGVELASHVQCNPLYLLSYLTGPAFHISDKHII